MERFDLESGREPVREDFPPSSRPDEFDDFEDFQRDYEDFRRGNAEEGEIEVIRERRRPRDMMSRSPSYNRDRDRDRDRGRSHHNHHHRDRSGSPRSWRTYSGISDLEDRRDGGRNYFDRSPRRYEGFDDVLDEGPVQVVPFLRLLTALEDILGSLGPNVNAILGRALSLEQNRPGASNILLEDPETACILDMTKEKLSGLMMAGESSKMDRSLKTGVLNILFSGLLEESKQGAVRVVMDHMARVLRQATRKRPDKPPTLGKAKSKKDQLKEVIKHSTLITSHLICLFSLRLLPINCQRSLFNVACRSSVTMIFIASSSKSSRKPSWMMAASLHPLMPLIAPTTNLLLL